jgi:hypothetical protein
MNTKIISLKGLLSVAVLAMAVVAFPSFAAEEREFDIPEGDLVPALKSVAKLTGLELIFQPKDLKGIRTIGGEGEVFGAGRGGKDD